MNESAEHDRKRFSLSAFVAAFLSVVLTVSLVLFSAFPCLGIQPIDDILHPESAHAIAGVDDAVFISAVVALAAVSGVYVAGSTVEEQNVNSTSLAQGFSDFLVANGNGTMQQQLVNNVANGVFSTSGLSAVYSEWKSYIRALTDDGKVVEGETSKAADSVTFNLPYVFEPHIASISPRYGDSTYSGVTTLFASSSTYPYDYFISGSVAYCYMSGSNEISIPNSLSRYMNSSGQFLQDSSLVMNRFKVSSSTINTGIDIVIYDNFSDKNILASYSSASDSWSGADVSLQSGEAQVVVAPDAMVLGDSDLPKENVDLQNLDASTRANGYSIDDIKTTVSDISITADGVLDFLQKAWTKLCDWVIDLGSTLWSIGNSIVNGINGVISGILDWLKARWIDLSASWATLLDWIKATPLATFIANVWDWLQAFSLQGVIDAVASIPSTITTWFQNFFFPNPDHFTDAVQQVKQAGITKLGIDSNSWGLNVGSRIPEGLSASLYLGILDTNDYVLFDPKFLIDGINTFRYVIQAFIGFLMFLFCYNNIVSMMGGRPISIIGHTITESGGKSGGHK